MLPNPLVRFGCWALHIPSHRKDFGEKLLRAKDFQEAFRIQAEYFQSRLKACAEDAAQIGAKMAGSFKQTG